MNKSEKTIVALLVVLLAGSLYLQHRSAAQRMAAAREAAAAAREATAADAASGSTSAGQVPVLSAAGSPDGAPAADAGDPASPDSPAAGAGDSDEVAEEAEEQLLSLQSDELEILLSSFGASIAKATLREFPATLDEGSGPVELDFSGHPALALSGIPGIGARSAFEIVEGENGGTNAVFRRALANGVVFERSITLFPGYEVKVRDIFRNPTGEAVPLASNALSLGVMNVEGGGHGKRSRYQVPSLGVDALPAGTGKAEHYDGRLARSFGVGGGGCSGAPPADGLPEKTAPQRIVGPCDWLAIKSRFFVSLLTCDAPNEGFTMEVSRDMRQPRLALQSVGAALCFGPSEIGPHAETVRTSSLYLGPKRLSSFWKMGGRRYQVMQFGWLTWLCLALVPLLNGLAVVGGGNYGVAIILVTILIRLLLWPLTHKGAEGAKRMQAIQPKLKELQAKFKDDPQKLQQETLLLYRENHVNPMSSCLPLLLQMPVLIAMYTVLRSAVELRYAPFLWIADLSEAENLFEGSVPFVGSLNILPILMAATMVVQTKLTPNMGGDASQQKMMTWMMPVMMLFMFYPLSSGLVLYWTVSNILAIVQTWLQQRAAKRSLPASQTVIDADSPRMTRQMRRSMSR